MNADEMKEHISSTFAGVRVMEAYGDTFFLYDPDGDLPPERQMPFATIVNSDNYERVSDLDQPGAYRLNIGLTKATYTAMFGAPPTERDEQGVLKTEFDYAERDRVMPHPVYASQHWVCVISPGRATLDAIGPLLTEAYDFAVRKHANHARRTAL
ncbi:DUF6194 family protein [Saccharothrix sp. S26]|uniref:DUF6194 family protein n=1 Tax=Saccharothrix sp. S26 TaxID=2907215 RepID=UPI001F2638F9|nr:DUF6194 family protein [Saccharothrix sp. S26]MCE6997832.1 DUF6194 family protein [Saccharothrix sp. S26]